MKAMEYPDRLREALREKLTALECSNKLAGVLFDVEAVSLGEWLNGKAGSLAPKHKDNVSFFVAGYLDGFMDWLKQEAEASPEETRALCRSLFALCCEVQRGQGTVLGGDRKMASLVRDVNDLLKKTLMDC